MSEAEKIQQAVDAAVKASQEAAPVRIPAIYLSGPSAINGIWCATCVMLFMGTVSAEPEFQEYAKEIHRNAMAAGASLVSIDLAARDDVQLQPAVTVAPSSYAPKGPPMPVCWTHVTGIRPATPEEVEEGNANARTTQSPIIPGKAYGDSQYRG